MGDVMWGKYAQKLPKRGVNRQFQARRPQFKHHNNSGTINLTNKRFEDRVQTTKSTLWVVCHYPIANTKWLTAKGRGKEGRGGKGEDDCYSKLF